MNRIRVFLVDDTAVVRGIVARILGEDPGIDVVGVAGDGAEGLQRLAQVPADLLVLDMEMPGMNGLDMLREMKRRGMELPVVVFSSLTERGALITIEALQAGASDYVTKPTMTGSAAEAHEHVRANLLPKIHALVERRRGVDNRAALPSVDAPAPGVALAAKTSAARVEAVVIGVSVGGPNALCELLPMLPADLPVPVFIVQHMPPVFTRALAARLHDAGPLPVRECTASAPVAPGEVWLAAGGRHMLLRREESGVRVYPDDGEPVNSCRPSADLLFRSAARAYGAGALGVVMTGMGNDGLEGSRALCNAGAQVIVQDQASSVVWGMPGSVARAGLAQAVLGLHELAADIARRVAEGRRDPPATLPATALAATTLPGGGARA